MHLAIAYVMVANTDDIQLNIHGGLMFTVQLSDREHSEIKNTAMFPRLQYIFFQTTASKYLKTILHLVIGITRYRIYRIKNCILLTNC